MCQKVLTKPMRRCANDGTEIPKEVLALFSEKKDRVAPAPAAPVTKTTAKKKKFPIWLVAVVAVVCIFVGKGLLGQDSQDAPGYDYDQDVMQSPTEFQGEIQEHTLNGYEDDDSTFPTNLPISQENGNLLNWIEYCDQSYLTEQTLEGLDAAQCRLARNAIFAKSGRKFADAGLTEYFTQFDWYVPRIDPDSFNDSMLNAYQLYNVDVIIAYEEACGYR